MQLPLDKWIYLALSYKHDTTKDQGTLSAIYADADHDSPVDILKDAPTNDINLRGRLVVGGPKMKGRMRDLTLWNDTRDVQQLYTDREKSKAAYMPGLVGYWRMNEGYGTTVDDKAHSRNMTMAAESWYINNDNRAAKLTAEQALDIDISTFAPLTTDNYALELWFRADGQGDNGNASLIDLPNCLRLGFKDSKLTMKSYQRHIDERGVETYDVTLDDEVLSEQNLIDNNWHHLALNVRRGSSAVAYIDGAAVKTLPESSIPALAGSNLYVGKGFTGGIDDVRIWNAALESKNIADRRHERLDSTYAGLIGYFPFESIHRTMSGTVTTEFSLYNFGDKKVSKLTASGVDKEHNLSASSPALLPISQRMRLADVEYNFTASRQRLHLPRGQRERLVGQPVGAGGVDTALRLLDAGTDCHGRRNPQTARRKADIHGLPPVDEQYRGELRVYQPADMAQRQRENRIGRTVGQDADLHHRCQRAHRTLYHLYLCQGPSEYHPLKAHQYHCDGKCTRLVCG